MKNFLDKDIVFGKEWFEKYQSRLLWLLNTPFVKTWFRWCLRIKRSDCRGRIIEIQPNNFIYENGSKICQDFRTHDKYSKRLYYAFKPFWYILHAFDWAMLDRVELLTKYSFGFSTLTAYPDANPETSTVDGSVVHDVGGGGGLAWATLVAAAGTSASDSVADPIAVGWEAKSISNEWAAIYRWIGLFDTSSLTSSATISAATLGFTTDLYQSDGTNNPNVNVYSSNPASNTALTSGDFDTLGTTAFATGIAFGSLTTDGSTYNTFTLNASGISAISKTGISKFGFRTENDANSSAPTWVSAQVSRI